jgi:hypothetical protein
VDGNVVSGYKPMAVSGCRPTAGLGLAGLDLAGHQDPRLQQLYFLIFFYGSYFGGFDFLFFIFMGLALDLVFFFFSFSHGSGDF